MFELEPCGQADRIVDNVNVVLLFRILDDRLSRVYQEVVEVSEEETVELIQVSIEDLRVFDPQMSHEDGQTLLVDWRLTRDRRYHASRFEFHSRTDQGSGGHRQSFGKEPRLHRLHYGRGPIYDPRIVMLYYKVLQDILQRIRKVI